MYNRLTNLSKSNSFFLFGARGVGKTKLIELLFAADNPVIFDLLDPEVLGRLDRDPSSFSAAIAHLTRGSWVVVDEVQKLPKLLELVHQQIEKRGINFALTGSSARKLKRGAANLLAGRAFLFNLFPLTSLELGANFDLNTYLAWGGLPFIHGKASDLDRLRYLRSYSHTYLQEQIIQEQIVRNLTPFRKFIEVAALSHGQVVNYSRIAHDISSDASTVKGYFQILEETLVGSTLPAFQSSVRKRFRTSPKFYLIDPGIVRALRGSVEIGVVPGSFEYGRLFEGFVIGELQRRLAYAERSARFSFILTKDDAEIDLVIERPNHPLQLVEIKSSNLVSKDDCSVLNRFAADLEPCQAFLLSRDPVRKRYDRVEVLNWAEGITTILGDIADLPFATS